MLALGLVCAKISAGAGYAIRRSRLRRRFGRFRRVVEVRGGWYGAGQPPLTSTTSRTSTNLPRQRRNGTGAEVMTKRNKGAHARLRRGARSGRRAASTGGGA